MPPATMKRLDSACSACNYCPGHDAACLALLPTPLTCAMTSEPSKRYHCAATPSSADFTFTASVTWAMWVFSGCAPCTSSHSTHHSAVPGCSTGLIPVLPLPLYCALGSRAGESFCASSIGRERIRKLQLRALRLLHLRQYRLLRQYSGQGKARLTK